MKPDNPWAHAHLGSALLRDDKFDDAVTALREAIRLKPDDVDSHYGLGYALQFQEKFDEAVTAYRAAIRLKPDYAEAHYALGNGPVRSSARKMRPKPNSPKPERLKPDINEQP